MRHERVTLSEKSCDIVSYLLYNRGSTNRPERERMKRLLYRAIRHELTDRQRDCLTLHYLQRMKVKDIAAQLGLSKSTVSRHITAAERKLRHVAAYYERL
ncbi:MAG: sigma-70 family RNA polymerase sigma factor [Ruminococcus sp.]|nr:sigma-70 family RNA polymerase sigma factor [Ruminococcus sp.]